MRMVVGAVVVLALVAAAEGRATGYSPDSYFAPEWARDGSSLVVQSRTSRNPQIVQVALDGRMTKLIGLDGPARPSARGELAYLAPIDLVAPTGRLTIRQADGGTRALGRAMLVGGLGWSPDGAAITYTAESGNVATIDADGTHFREYDHRGTQPAWSPDGRSIAFVGRAGTSILDVATGSARVVGPAAVGIASRAAVTWSPDSTRLALSLNPGMAIARADGGREVVLVRDAHYPSWSPDGTELAVQFGDDIVVVDASGKSRRTVVASKMREIEPAWSPDGRWIAYANMNHTPPGQAYQAGHAADVFVVRPDGTGRQSLTGGCGVTAETPLNWLCAVNGKWSVPISAAPARTFAVVANRSPRAIMLAVHVRSGERYVSGARVTVRQASGPRVRVTTTTGNAPILLSDTGGRAAFRFVKPPRRGTVVLRITVAEASRLFRVRV